MSTMSTSNNLKKKEYLALHLEANEPGCHGLIGPDHEIFHCHRDEGISISSLLGRLDQEVKTFSKTRLKDKHES